MKTHITLLYELLEEIEDQISNREFYIEHAHITNDHYKEQGIQDINYLEELHNKIKEIIEEGV